MQYLSNDPLTIILLDFKKGVVDINTTVKRIEELNLYKKKKHNPCSRQG